MASFNKVILIGNLTRDPEVRFIPSGMAVCEIGLAVNRTWWDKQSNSKKEEVAFIDVTLWGREAEVAGEYLAKGRPVLVEGRLHLDTWDDKQSGQKRSKLKVVCEHMQMLGSRGDGAPAGGGGSTRPATASRPSAPGRESEPTYGSPPGGYDSGPPPGGDDVPF